MREVEKARMGPRRNDIQGLRGFCLLAVVFFHIWPNKFVNGFVGVDMFFVISGYLIYSNLASNSCLSLEVMADFYKRRFKRIVPMYALILLASVAFGGWLFTDRLINTTRHKLPWAAAFATNIGNMFDTKDYWTLVNELHLFTHTWSLGVEVQFYLLAPFIVLMERFIGNMTKAPSFIFRLLLILSSLLGFMLSGPFFSFNIVLSRLWQFMFVTVACDIWSSLPLLFHLETMKNEEDLKKIRLSDRFTNLLCLGLSFLIIITIFLPDRSIDSLFLRLFAVFSVSLLILLGQKPFTRATIFELPLMTFLGDISYVAYLVHWPIIVFSKFIFDIPAFGLFDGSFVLLVSLFLSSVIHFHLERPSLFWPFPLSTAIVILAYGLCALSFTPLLYRARHQLFINESIWSSESYLYNNHLDQHWKSEHKNQSIFFGCVQDDEGRKILGKTFNKMERSSHCIVNGNSSSHLDILLVGNSFASFSAPHFQSISEGRFRILRGIIQKGCSFFQPQSIRCQQYREAIYKIAEATRPSIVIISIRTYAPQMGPIEQNDSALAQMEQVLTRIRSYAHFVVMDDTYPAARVPSTVPTSLLKRARFNQSHTDLRQDYKAYSNRFRHYCERMRKLNDSNIIRLETGKLLFNGSDYFTWYNPHNGHSRYYDDYHLTAETFGIVVPKWKAALENIFDSLALIGIA